MKHVMLSISTEERNRHKNWVRTFVQEQALFSSEAAELLGCSQRDFQKLVQRGIIKPFKENGNVGLFLQQEVMRYKEFKEKETGFK
ncbi:helix-turn-helix domain-containing protein [Bacillales bacterium AN1005]